MPRLLEVRIHDSGFLAGPQFAGIRAAARDAIRARVASGKKYGLCICWQYMPIVNRFVKVNMPWRLWEDDAISFLVPGLPPRRWVVAHIQVPEFS